MRGEAVAGAMGFVDVLIGAMAAVVLLFMAQAARPPVKPGFGVGGPTLRVELDVAATGQPTPELAVRYRLGGRAVPLAAAGLGRAGEKRLIHLSGADGGTDYKIKFAEKARFDDGEELLIYVHDLKDRPWTAGTIVVRARLEAGDKTRSWSMQATAAHPVIAVPLGQLSGQRDQPQEFVWQQR